MASWQLKSAEAGYLSSLVLQDLAVLSQILFWLVVGRTRRCLHQQTMEADTCRLINENNLCIPAKVSRCFVEKSRRSSIPYFWWEALPGSGPLKFLCSQDVYLCTKPIIASLTKPIIALTSPWETLENMAWPSCFSVQMKHGNEKCLYSLVLLTSQLIYKKFMHTSHHFY